MINPINHVERGVNEVTSYFKTKEDYLKLLKIFLLELQEVSDELVKLAEMKDLSTVTGIWLDYLGKILGEERAGRDDEEYRKALQLRVAINTSDGTAPVVQEIIKTYTKSDYVRVAEGILSFGQIIFNGDNNADLSLWALMQEIQPVTVKTILAQDTENKCFFPAWEVTTSLTEVFEVFTGGVSDPLSLVLTEGYPASSFYVSQEGKEGVLDPDTDSKCFLEWEEGEEFQVNTGIGFECLELVVAEGETSCLEIFGTDTIKNETLLPWEINEDSKNIIPDPDPPEPPIEEGSEWSDNEPWYDDVPWIDGEEAGNILDFEGTLTASFNNPSPIGEWDFGDNTTSTQEDPTHEYALHGKYDVSFFDGAETLEYVVNMGGDKAPTAEFTYLLNELVVNFDASLSSDPEGTDLTYEWDFGDGQTGTGLLASNTYAIGGTYEVTLVVKDSGNVWGSIKKEIRCNALPVASYDYRKNLLQVRFTNTSSDLEGTFSSYWDFGDGNVSYSKDPIHTYAGDIDADVTLVVKDLNGEESIPYTEQLRIRSYWVLGDELMPPELAAMESDPNGQINFVGSQGTFEGTYLAYEGLQSYGRIEVTVPVGELEVGAVYVLTTRIQLLTGYGQIRSFTAGYVDTVNLIDDGAYHEYQVPFECTDPDGDMRISIDGTANIDTFSLKKEI